jgi:hypothetical protein
MGGDCSTLKSCIVSRHHHTHSPAHSTPYHRDIHARSQSKVLELVEVKDYPATARSLLVVD